MNPAAARKVVFLAHGSDVGIGSAYLAAFAAGAVLHRSVFELGAIADRLVPIFVEDEAGGCHFADVAALQCPGLAVDGGTVAPSSLAFALSAETAVELVAPQYSVVVCVSVRASSAMIDPYSGQVLMERNAGAMEAVVKALASPYCFSWRHAGGPSLRPTVHLSIVAEAGTGWDSAATLAHGVVLGGPIDLPALLREVGEKLRDFERVAAQASRTNACGELGFGLRTAAFLMGMMPQSVFQNVVMIADGVASAPDMSVYDCPLMLLRRQGMAVYVVQTAAYQPFQTLGCVPSCETLQQLAMSGGGFYFDLSSNSELSQLEKSDPAELLAVLNHSLLSIEWRAKGATESVLLLPRASYAPYLKEHHMDERNVLSEVLLEPHEFCYDIMVLNDPYPWEGEAPRVPILRQMVHEYHLSSDCWSLFSARLHEGFRFLSVEAKEPVDGSCDFELSVWLAWLPNVKIVYTIASTVDVGVFNSAMQRPSSVTMYVYAHYEFLLRLSQAKDTKRVAPGVAAIQKFVKRIVQTDKVLNRLSVNSSAVLSTCDPTSGALPSEHQEAFWQIVASLGKNPWQRWFVLRHVMFVLRPDKIDTSNLTANDEITFAGARNALLVECKDWSSFSTGGNFFCRLVAPAAASDGRPTGFCLLRPLFPTPSLAVLQFSLFGASQLHLDREVETFQARFRTRASRCTQLSFSFFPALLLETEGSDQQVMANVMPEVGMFPGPAGPRLSALQWYRSWGWKVSDAALRSRLLAMLRRNRVFDRLFVLAWNSGTFVLEAPVSASRKACMQCRAVEVGDDSLLLEHWMEPIWKNGADAFDRILKHMQSNDLRVVTEMFTWRVANDILENKPGVAELMAVQNSPPVSASALLRGARASFSVSLDLPEFVESGRLFSLLCRSLVLLSGCAIPEGAAGTSPPSAFASTSSQKNMVLTRAMRGQGKTFVVEVSEIRLRKLGLPAAPEDAETVDLFGTDMAASATVASSAATAAAGPRRQLRPDALAICSIAAQLHKRNIVRAIYSALEDGQFVPASSLQPLVFASCVEVAMEVDLSEFLLATSFVPLTQQHRERLSEEFLGALAGVNFVQIPKSSEFFFSGGKQKQPPTVTAAAAAGAAVMTDLTGDRASLPPMVAAPASAVATWDEESLLTLKEMEVFGCENAFPFFLRLALDCVDKSNPVLPRVVSSEVLSSLPVDGCPSKAQFSSVLRLGCLTLPPYRSRGGDVTYKSRSRRLPDVPEEHSPFRASIKVTDLPPVLQSGMSSLKQRVADFASTQVVDLLRFVPLTEKRRTLLIKSMASLQHVVREKWASRLCRDSGPALLRQLLPKVASDALRMRELVLGGPVAQWVEDGEAAAEGTALVSHWLLLEADADGGLLASLFAGSLSEEEGRNQLREANVKVWEPLLRMVNQLSLLKELHETRVCPPLLEAPGPADPIASLPSTRDARFGLAGSLACPQQGEETLVRMHPRLGWEQARRLLFRTLQLFAVEDRSGLFVYSEAEQYWYFRLSHRQSDDGAFVVMTCFGLSLPPQSLLADVTRLVSTSLSQATVAALAQDALRNPIVKLVAQDLAFLRSGDTPPARHYLQLPVVARCAIRVRWWDLFRQECASLRPVWVEGQDAPSKHLFLFATSTDGLAFVYLRCRGTTESYGNSAATVEEFFSPMFSWTERVNTEEEQKIEIEDGEVAQDEREAEFGIFATVWPKGQMLGSTVLESLTGSLFKARAKLGLEVALGSLKVGAEWSAVQLSQVWDLLERSAVGGNASTLSFRLKGLALLGVHMVPLATTVLQAIAVEHCNIFFRCDGSSALEKSRCDPLEHPLSQVVVIARATIAGESSVVVAVIAKDMLELRSYGFQDGVVKSVREACTQYLSWAGFRVYLLQGVLYAKMGLPFHRDLGKNKVRVTENLMEMAATGAMPSSSSSSSRPAGCLSNSGGIASLTRQTSGKMEQVLPPQLKDAIPAAVSAPDSARGVFGGKKSLTRIAPGRDPVSRHVCHWLQETAAEKEAEMQAAYMTHTRLLAVNTGELFGSSDPVAASSLSPSSPGQAAGGATATTPTKREAEQGSSEPFYSYPRSTPLRLEAHVLWLRRVALKELRHSFLALGFQLTVTDVPDQLVATMDVPGRGKLEIFAGFRHRLSAFGKATIVTVNKSAGGDSSSMCSVVELCRLCDVARHAVSVRALCVDVACISLAQIAQGLADQRDCWVRGVLRAAGDAVGSKGNRCQIQSVDLNLNLPQEKHGGVSDFNAFEVMRYLGSHAADYGMYNLAEYGVEPVLCLSLPAAAMLARTGMQDLRMWGIANESDVSQEQWTMLVLYVHVRGEAENKSDQRRLKVRVLFARTPLSTRSVCPVLYPLDTAVFFGIVSNPVKRVLSDFAHDQLWRAMHVSVAAIDVAAVVAQSSVLVAPPTVPHLASTLKNASVQSWDAMLSHLQRWRPNLLRPYTAGTGRHVVVLQRGASNPTGSPSASLKNVAVPAREEAGLLPELERIQSGQGYTVPDFAILLSRADPMSPLSCAVVRRRSGDAPLSDAEMAELDQVSRALAIWMWMLKQQ